MGMYLSGRKSTLVAQANNILVVALLLINDSAFSQLHIPYATTDKSIDGVLDDWQAMPIEIKSNVLPRYRNENRAAVEWDEEFLYVCFDIKDKLLCANESGDSNPRLYFNDAVEIYLDAKNDSGMVMDKNDYQFLVAITGDKVIFEGDKHLIQEGYLVPKDFDNNNIIIKSGVSFHGTINQMNDTDVGYSIEAAIPWTTVGLVPSKDMYMRLDLCVDDIDTFTNIVAIPDTVHPLSMNFVNLSGKTEFGFPQDWTVFRLEGEPSTIQQIRKYISSHFMLFVSLLTLIVAAFTFIILRQYRKLKFYKNFPRKVDTDEVLHVSSNESEPVSEASATKPLHETIEKTRHYIIANIDNDLNMEDLSKAANIGIRQLQRLFKSEIGITPVQYINILKLEEAGLLLKTTNMTVAEIAYKLSFNDPSYFGSVFKKYYGMTPLEYRKMAE
jgi:AraC-like DNA-binding protein